MIAALLALGLVARPLADRPTDRPTDSLTDGSHLAVYVVTFGPGPEVWERWGHNALWIRDTVSGENAAWDYGRFSFGNGFLAKFARGQMFYWMGKEDGVALVNFYIKHQRSVYLQELDLRPDQRVALREYLDGAYAMDRGRYRYDYYVDNCSTRVRDAIDHVIGGRIRASLDSGNSGTTYRWHTRRSLENNVLYWAGADAALGPAVDQPITRYRETFLPGMLHKYLRTVSLADSAGGRPLVRGEITLNESGEFLVPDTPPEWTLRFLLAGFTGGLVLFVLGLRGRSAAWARTLFGFLGGSWALIAGAGGFLLLFLWLGSDHQVAWRNQNLWHLNLLALPLVALLPGALRRNPVRRPPAVALAFLLVACSVLGVIAKGLPGFEQANWEIIALALPIHAGLAFGLRAAVRSPSPSGVLPALP